MRINLTM